MTLTIEIEREDDGRWFAEVPALAGVMTYGKDRDEAVARVQGARAARDCRTPRASGGPRRVAQRLLPGRVSNWPNEPGASVFTPASAPIVVRPSWNSGWISSSIFMKLASRHGILDDMHPQRPHWNSTHEVTSAFVRELEGIAWKVVTQQPTGPHPLEPFRFDGKYGRTGTEKSLTIGDGRAWPS